MHIILEKILWRSFEKNIFFLRLFYIYIYIYFRRESNVVKRNSFFLKKTSQFSGFLKKKEEDFGNNFSRKKLFFYYFNVVKTLFLQKIFLKIFFFYSFLKEGRKDF